MPGLQNGSTKWLLKCPTYIHFMWVKLFTHLAIRGRWGAAALSSPWLLLGRASLGRNGRRCRRSASWSGSPYCSESSLRSSSNRTSSASTPRPFSMTTQHTFLINFARTMTTHTLPVSRIPWFSGSVTLGGLSWATILGSLSVLLQYLAVSCPNHVHTYLRSLFTLLPSFPLSHTS